MRGTRCAAGAVLLVTLAACSNASESGTGSAGTKAPTIETHSAASEGVFNDTRWRLTVTKGPDGATCRTSVELPDDGAGGVPAGDCLSLDRLEDFLVIDQGIESSQRLSYAAGLHSADVEQVRLVFNDGSAAVGPVEGDAFLILWEGVGNASGIEFLNGKGRVISKCELAGDSNRC